MILWWRPAFEFWTAWIDAVWSPVAVVVRPASMADAPAMAALHATAFEHPWRRSEFEALLAEPNVLGHLARPGPASASPVAFVLSRRSADEAEILSIAVSPSHRGAGVGRQLMQQQIEYLPLVGVRALYLEVSAANEPALALYRRLDFVEVGRRAAYYRQRDGSAAEALILRRELA